MNDSAGAMRFAAKIASVCPVVVVCSECFASRRPARNPPKTARQTPHASQKRQGEKILSTRTMAGNAPRATPALVEGDFPRRGWRRGEALRTPARRRRDTQQRGTGNLKHETTLSRPRPARASATPSPRGPPSRRPSRSRRSSAARRRPRRARRVSGPRPKVWFLRAFAAGAV